jgi:agmatine deiminase
MQSPKEAEYSMAAEWQPHEAVWLAWPSHKSLWQENLKSAQDEFKSFCMAIADVDPMTHKARGEKLNILIPDTKYKGDAEDALNGLPIKLFTIPFGDIWLRDTAPLFLNHKSGHLATLRFSFNGWGGKYNLDNDPQVAENISKEVGFREFIVSSIMEGGSLEVDGEGTCLTSRQCLLNKNRNNGMTERDLEKLLEDSLGVEKILWLGNGLVNDHTDGHIDTMARFSAPGKVLCMTANTSDDPNIEVLKTMKRDLESMTDARGRKLEVSLIPSPGKILNDEGEIMPASYLNFYIANTTVIVPIYGSPFDDKAIREIAKCFPTRRTVGLPAKAILAGGGAFHCISQQQPSDIKRNK